MNNTYNPVITFLLHNVNQGRKTEFKENNGNFLYFYNIIS